MPPAWPIPGVGAIARQRAALGPIAIIDAQLIGEPLSALRPLRWDNGVGGEAC